MRGREAMTSAGSGVCSRISNSPLVLQCVGLFILLSEQVCRIPVCIDCIGNVRVYVLARSSQSFGGGGVGGNLNHIESITKLI